MKKQYGAAIGVVLALALGAGLIWFSRKAPGAAPVTTPSAAVPSNAAHEIASLEEELRKKPGHGPILMRLADLNQEAGKPAEAAKYLKQIVEAEPSNYQARLELGRTLHDSGDIEGAIVETKKIIEKDPQNVDALYNLGAIYGNQGKLSEAKDYFVKAVAADASSDSGQKAKAAIAQLAAPPAAPASGVPSGPLPPGHPAIGAAVSGGAVVDRLLEADPKAKSKK